MAILQEAGATAAGAPPLTSRAGAGAETGPPPARRGRVDWPSLGTKLLAVVLLIAVWQLASFFQPPTFLPGPALVFQRVLELIANGELIANVVPTVSRVLIGFAVALLLGSAVGIAMGANRFLESFFEAYILIGLTVPGLAWAVLALMWFGITEFSPVFAIVVVTTPMLAVNMWQGTKALDNELLEMARAFRIRRGRVIRDIVVPQLLPYLFAGSRFGFALGWKVVVLSEMFGLTSGVGYMINRSFSLYSMQSVLAWTIGFTLVMILFEYGVLRPAEQRLLRWRPAVAL